MASRSLTLIIISLLIALHRNFTHSQFCNQKDNTCTSSSQNFCKLSCSISQPDLTITALLTEPLLNLSNTFYPLSYPRYQSLASLATPFTVTTSFKAEINSRGYLFFFGTSTQTRPLAIHIHDAGLIWVYMTLDDGTTHLSQFQPSIRINNGQRHCLALVVNKTSLLLYIHNEITETLITNSPSGRYFDITSNLISSNAPSLTIGARVDGKYRFTGDIYYLYLYYGVLNFADTFKICKGGLGLLNGTCTRKFSLGDSCPKPTSLKLIRGLCYNSLDRCGNGLSCLPSGPDDEWICRYAPTTTCRDYTDCIRSKEFCVKSLPSDGTSEIMDPELDLIDKGRTYIDTLHDFTKSDLTFLTVPAAIQPHPSTGLTIFGVFTQMPENDAYLVAKGDNVYIRDFGLYLRGSHDATWLIYSTAYASYTQQIFLHTTPIDDGLQHTIGAVIDMTTVRASLYVDGQLIGYQVLDAKPLCFYEPIYRFYENSMEMWIGGRPQTDLYMFNGTISHVSTYDYALSGVQIRHLSEYFTNSNSQSSAVMNYCLPKQNLGQKCYTNPPADRTFTCQKGLTCIPGALFPYVPYPIPIISNIDSYITPSPIGYCADPNCNCAGISNNNVCGENGVTYNSQCDADCHGVPVLALGECPSYTDLYQNYSP